MRGRANAVYSEDLRTFEAYKFKKRGRFPYDSMEAYLVESEIVPVVQYGIEKDRVFIIHMDGFLVCPMNDIERLLKSLKEPIRDELKDILKDTEDLRRMNVNYEKPMSNLYATVRRVPRKLRGV